MTSLLLHEVRIRRRTILWWTIGLGFFAIMYMAFFPSLPDDFLSLDIESIDIYKSMGVESIATFEGYMQSTVFNFLPLLVGAFGIVLGAGALAGEEDAGTLELVAALPISRLQLFTAKAAAVMVAAFLVILAVAGGVAAAFLAIESEIDTAVTAVDLFWVVLSHWLIAFAFLALGLMLGAYLPSRGSTLAASAALLVLTFFANNLAGMVTELERLQPLFPFWYFSRTTEMLTGNVPWDDVAALAVIGLILLVLGALSFQRRNLTVAAWPWQRPQRARLLGAAATGGAGWRRVALPLAAVGLLAVVALGAVAIATALSEDFRSELEGRLGIETTEVITGSGELINPEATIVSEAAGRVTSVLVSEGDRVSAGDALLAISDDTSLALSSEARGLIDLAWVFAAEYLTGVPLPSANTSDLEAAAKDARAEALAARDALRDAAVRGSDATLLAELEARADLETARERIAEARLALAEDRLSTVDVEAVLRAVRELKALELLERPPIDWSAASPVAGSVSAVLVTLGDAVSEGAALARVTDRQSLELRFRVSERDADRIAIGQGVELDVDGLEYDRDGEVIAVERNEADSTADAADEDLHYVVRVKIADPRDELEAGIDAEARIELPDPDNGDA